MTSTPAIGRAFWSVSRPRTSPTVPSSTSIDFHPAVVPDGMQPADLPVSAASEQPHQVALHDPIPHGLLVPGVPQDEPTLAVGRAGGHRLEFVPPAAHRPDLSVRHAGAGLIHDPPSDVILYGAWADSDLGGSTANAANLSATAPAAPAAVINAAMAKVSLVRNISTNWASGRSPSVPRL